MALRVGGFREQGSYKEKEPALSRRLRLVNWTENTGVFFVPKLLRSSGHLPHAGESRAMTAPIFQCVLFGLLSGALELVLVLRLRQHIL